MKNVLIADDHEIVRRGIRMIIENFPEKYNFIEAATCDEVVKALSIQQIHYAVLDMFMTDGNIFSVLEQIIEIGRGAAILVYSMNAERIYARRFIEKGIRGFLCKQASIDELEDGIRTVFNGEIYLSPELKETFVNAGLPPNPIESLSNRELEVAEYVAAGMTLKEISGIMRLDSTTVSTYRRRAFEKLGVQNNIELKDKILLYKM